MKFLWQGICLFFAKFQYSTFSSMKNPLLLVISLMLTLNIFSQGYGKPIEFKSIEMVDSSTRKETLYWNGMEWLGKHFNNANKVIQIADKDAGIILARGNFGFDAPGTLLSGSESRIITFMIKFSFKDGKYKLELSDFNDSQFGLITDGDYEEHSMNKKNVAKQWKAAQDKTRENISFVYNSIKEFMFQTSNW